MPELKSSPSNQSSAAASARARPRILLLSGYDAGSHRRWREQLVASQPAFDWTVLTLPPRHFRWRIRGNAMSWLDEPAMQAQWDLVVATSMVDVAGIRALHPALRNVPVLLYMHENQFAYPDSGDQHSSVDPLMVNLYSALSADHVAFNSDWNRRSFLDGINQLLGKLPDAVPQGVADRIAAKSSVLPVPIGDELFGRPRQVEAGCTHRLWNNRWKAESPGVPLRLIWVSRWEYDKGPAQLLAILDELESRDLDYQLCVLGERFRRCPPEFEVIEARFGHRLVQFGYAASRDDYVEWLRSADVVFSTALHEFQGLAILEAVASGCVPLLPDRLSYPELFEADYLFESFPEDPRREAVSAVDKLERLAGQLESGRRVCPAVSDFSASALRSRYESLLRSFLNI